MLITMASSCWVVGVARPRHENCTGETLHPLLVMASCGLVSSFYIIMMEAV